LGDIEDRFPHSLILFFGDTYVLSGYLKKIPGGKLMDKILWISFPFGFIPSKLSEGI